MALPAEKLRMPPTFALPRQLKLSGDERKRIARMVTDSYRNGVTARTSWNSDHAEYDQMFRGNLPARPYKPWPSASDIHIQLPYWCVDAVNVRMCMAIWNQNPLVAAQDEEYSDAEKADKAARFCEWTFQEARMNARSMWSRASKIRLIHGCSVSLVSYVRDLHRYRTVEEDPTRPKVYLGDDEQGLPVMGPSLNENTVEEVFYEGCILHPKEWDDVVAPMDCMNLQPRRPSNPGGADQVILRDHERLFLMKQKAAQRDDGYPSLYEFMLEDGRDETFWINGAPSQDRSSSGVGQNNASSRQHDRADGINRTQANRFSPEAQKNPEFEVLWWFGAYEDPDTNEIEEVVFFVSVHPEVFLGGFYLSDYHWTGERPILEMHYQNVGTRWYSMGIMEIVKHLSAELDTIHNMRIDVGFVTNMPYFFYRATGGFDPNLVTIAPLKGIPVDDPREIVFPQLQGQNSFYEGAEQQLFTLVERVLGVTDLFLGISPTRGASARHATGFVGTQMEAEARMSDILNQDADSFSFLCRTVMNMEYQYGPIEREFRLFGKSSDREKMTRDDLWAMARYDYRLGANQGFFSHTIKQQQSQAVMEMAMSSPLMTGDMGRMWEAHAFRLRSIGIRNPEVFIGPKSAVSTSPKTQAEENSAMIQFQFGPGQPSPVHPSDDDRTHITELMEFMSSETFNNLKRPNEQAFFAHATLHQQQMSQKQQQQQAQAQQNAPQPQHGANGAGPPQGQADPMSRAASQISNVPSAGGVNLGSQLLSSSGGRSPLSLMTPPNFGGGQGSPQSVVPGG